MQFIPRGGEIYAHLFENRRTGLERSLFWNIGVELQSVEIDGEEWESSFACEWLVWPIKRLPDLDGMDLQRLVRPELVECSIYLVAEHHPAKVSDLKVREQITGKYKLDAIGSVDLEIDGKTISHTFDLQCDLNFGGIVVVPQSLDPRPATPAQVAEALSSFLALDGLREPRYDKFRYVFDPA